MVRAIRDRVIRVGIMRRRCLWHHRDREARVEVTVVRSLVRADFRRVSSDIFEYYSV